MHVVADAGCENCLGVTDASLRALRAGARLQELVLRGCPITTQGLALLLLNRSLALTTIYIEAETIDIESAHLSVCLYRERERERERGRRGRGCVCGETERVGNRERLYRHMHIGYIYVYIHMYL